MSDNPNRKREYVRPMVSSVGRAAPVFGASCPPSGNNPTSIQTCPGGNYADGECGDGAHASKVKGGNCGPTGGDNEMGNCYSGGHAGYYGTTGSGSCQSGTSAGITCVNTGGTARSNCYPNGNSAIGECYASGGSATGTGGTCYVDGQTASQDCRNHGGTALYTRCSTGSGATLPFMPSR